MGLETGDFIADLVPTNPDGATDYPAQGDDHLRLIKKVLQNSLRNSTAPVMLVPETTTSVGNSYSVAVTPVPSTLAVGFTAFFKANATNTGAATLSVGTGAISLRIAGQPINAGDITADHYYTAIFVGGYFELVVGKDIISTPNTLVYTPMIAIGSPDASQSIDWKQHDFQSLILDKSVTLSFSAPIGVTNNLTLLIKGDELTSGNTITLPGNVVVVNGSYTVNQNPAWDDIIRMTWDGSKYYARVFEGFRA